jgi:hypothetical protein
MKMSVASCVVNAERSIYVEKSHTIPMKGQALLK